MRKLYFFLASILAVYFCTIVFAAAEPFNRDLYFGISNGKDVTRLQRFLTDIKIYSGPVTGNFFTLTRAAVKKFQAAYGINPQSGYFGPKSRAVVNSELQKIAEAAQKAELPKAPPQEVPVPTPAPVPTTTPSEAKSSSPNPFQSSLKIAITIQSRTLSTASPALLIEFSLSDDAPSIYVGTPTEHGPNEEIAITRIKFKNNGDLPDGFFIKEELIDSITKEVIATALPPQHGVIEFILTPDPSKSNKGLLVSGKLYAVVGTMVTTNTATKPKVRLDILKAEDIDAKDFRDLSKVADITPLNAFPILGPTISFP